MNPQQIVFGHVFQHELREGDIDRFLR